MSFQQSMIRFNDRTASALKQMHAASDKRLKSFANKMRNRVIANSPVGWGRFFPQPGGTKTPSPRGYRGGTNRRSIQIEKDGTVYRIYTTSGYGGWLELGTARMTARPYFKPAYDETVAEFNRGGI